MIYQEWKRRLTMPDRKSEIERWDHAIRCLRYRQTWKERMTMTEDDEAQIIIKMGYAKSVVLK